MRKILSIIVLSCFLFPQFAFAGAWTLPQGNIWGEYAFKINWAKKNFDNERKLNPKTRNAHTWGWTMNPKVEYGILDWFTVLGGLEYKDNKYKEYDRGQGWSPYSVKHHAISEAQAGARVRIIDKPFVLSAQAKIHFYTGYQDLPLEDVAEAPELGDRANMLDLRLMAGKKFETAIPFYLGAESGYRFKDRNAANDIPFFIEGGFWPLSWLLIKSELDGFLLSPNSGRQTKKEYAIWRIGPSFDLLEIFDILTGNKKEQSSKMNTVTREGKALNFEVQYGNWVWGRNVDADQEVVFKISGQY